MDNLQSSSQGSGRWLHLLIVARGYQDRLGRIVRVSRRERGGRTGQPMGQTGGFRRLKPGAIRVRVLLVTTLRGRYRVTFPPGRVHRSPSAGDSRPSSGLYNSRSSGSSTDRRSRLRFRFGVRSCRFERRFRGVCLDGRAKRLVQALSMTCYARSRPFERASVPFVPLFAVIGGETAYDGAVMPHGMYDNELADRLCLVTFRASGVLGPVWAS